MAALRANGTMLFAVTFLFEPLIIERRLTLGPHHRTSFQFPVETNTAPSTFYYNKKFSIVKESWVWGRHRCGAAIGVGSGGAGEQRSGGAGERKSAGERGSRGAEERGSVRVRGSRGAFNQEQPTNNQQPTTKNKQPTTNNKQPRTTNQEQPTTNNRTNGDI